jgi:hypothetical protein
MVVYPGGIFYQHIDPARLRRIAREHLANGTPVADYLWADPAQPYRRREQLPHTPSPQQPTYGARNPRDDSRPQKKPRKTYDVDDFKW